jgi:hypothetical protein
LQLRRDEARVEKLSAQAGGAHWTGSVALPRGCGVPGACVVRFNLNSEEISLNELSEWLGSQPSQRRWYQVLTSDEPAATAFLENLRASGKVSAGILRINDIVANKVSASVELEHGKLTISQLRADLLGGKHRGDWRADFTAASPVYTGSGTLTGISAAKMAAAMHDPWISGTAGGTYRLTASGSDSSAFWETAEGELQFDLRDGMLPHISLTSDEGPLRIARWRGSMHLHGGKVEIDKETLVSAAGTYEISGTASLGRALDLKLARSTDMKPGRAGTLVYSITGTVAEPRVALTPAPETQARLKP